MNVIDVAGDLYLLLAALGLCISVQYADLPMDFTDPTLPGNSAFIHLTEAVQRCIDAGVMDGDTLTLSVVIWASGENRCD